MRNRERLREKKHIYYQENLAKEKERRRRWHLKNREKNKETCRLWRLNNPDKVRQDNARRLRINGIYCGRVGLTLREREEILNGKTQ